LLENCILYLSWQFCANIVHAVQYFWKISWTFVRSTTRSFGGCSWGLGCRDVVLTSVVFWVVTLHWPVCGVRQTAGGAYEVTGGTENWKVIYFNYVMVKLFKWIVGARPPAPLELPLFEFMCRLCRSLSAVMTSYPVTCSYCVASRCSWQSFPVPSRRRPAKRLTCSTWTVRNVSTRLPNEVNPPPRVGPG